MGRFVSYGAALVTSPLIARTIGPEGRGETATVISLTVLVPVLVGLGVPMVVRRATSKNDSGASLAKARRFVPFALAATVPLSVALYFTLFATYAGQARLFAAVCVASTPLVLSWTLDMNYFVGVQRFRAVFTLQCGQALIFVAALTVGVLTNAVSVSFVLVANLTSHLAMAVVGRLLARPSARLESSLAEFVGSGTRYYGAAVAEASSNRLDSVLAVPVLGAAQAGFYSTATTVANLPMAIAMALSGRHFQAMARSSGPDLTALQAKVMREANALALVTVTVLVPASIPLVPLLFGEAFEGAVPATVLALIGVLFSFPGYVGSMALGAEGRGIDMTRVQVVSLIVATALGITLGKLFGVEGYAVGSSLGYLLLVTLVLRSLRLSPLSVFPRHRDFRRALSSLFREAR